MVELRNGGMGETHLRWLSFHIAILSFSVQTVKAAINNRLNIRRTDQVLIRCFGSQHHPAHPFQSIAVKWTFLNHSEMLSGYSCA